MATDVRTSRKTTGHATPDRWPTPGCFDDIRILEIGDECVDFCGLLMAGEGADVIKIEPPEGSPSRNIGPFLDDLPDRNRSLHFWTYNRGKRGITLDFASPEGRARYVELVKTADVIIDAQGLGVMDALKLGYDPLSAIRPGLIYCSITPFGLTGPWRHFKTSDLIHQALGGSAYCIGYDQVSPGKWDTPPFMAQAWHSFAIAAEHAAVAIAAAVFHRDSSGEGQFIDVSMHDACAQSTEATVSRYIYNGRHQVRNVPQQVRCADGRYLAIVIVLLRLANLPKLVEMLLASGECDELTDPKYRDTAMLKTPAAIDSLVPVLKRWVGKRKAADAFHQLQTCAVLCGPARPPEDLLEDPQSIARQDFVDIEHPELNRSFTYPRHPRIQTETPWRWGPRAPLLGEHNEDI